MTKDGKDFERLVALIESSLAPDARVSHNEFLPILNSRKGATTQCDVVIREGPKHREMITLVEVQDRDEKVKPNDVRGWRKKLEDVGAQRLICVSRQDFSESIREQAALSGQSVILVCLKEIPPESLPANFLQCVFEYRHFQVPSLDRIQVTTSRSEAEEAGVREAARSRQNIDLNELFWFVGGRGPVSLYTLCRDYCTLPPDMADGHGTITFERDASPTLHFLIGGIRLKVGLECKFQWTLEITRKPVSVLTYEQDAEGILVWVAEVKFESPKGPLLLRLPLIQDGDHYILQSLYAELPLGVEVTLTHQRRS